jgi:hypothetical protein
MDEATRDPDATLAMKRMHRKLSRSRRRAKRLTKTFLDKMLTAENDNARRPKNKILLLMGFETMRQLAEIVGFEYGDLTCLLNGKPALRHRFYNAD